MVGQLELKQRGESYSRLLVQRRLRSPSRVFLLFRGYKIPSSPATLYYSFLPSLYNPSLTSLLFIYTHSQWLGAGVSSTFPHNTSRPYLLACTRARPDLHSRRYPNTPPLVTNAKSHANAKLDESEKAHQEVYNGDEQHHEGKFSHEFAAGAASFAGMKAYEDHQRKDGTRHTAFHSQSNLYWTIF